MGGAGAQLLCAEWDGKRGCGAGNVGTDAGDYGLWGDLHDAATGLVRGWGGGGEMSCGGSSAVHVHILKLHK